MKPFAIILVVLVLLAVAALGYLYFTAKLDIRFETCIATDGITQVDYFDALKARVESGSFVGTRYTDGALSTADRYQFLTYTVSLDNRSFLKAELIEIRVTNMPGDVLQIGEEIPHDLPAGQRMDLSATILADRGSHSVREATVSWYFWGIPFTSKLTFGK